MNKPLLASIQAGLEALSIPDDGTSAGVLSDYVQLLVRWNKTYNLTAVREPEQMVSAHLMDSLAILPYIKGPIVMDVGTGAGLPGIPLSLFTPETQWVLIDSNGKKTRFVFQAIAELGLSNVTVRHARVEDVDDVQPSQIVTRAYASITDMMDSVQHLMNKDTRLLAMKTDDSEIREQTPANVQLIASHQLIVPGLSANRCLLELGYHAQAGDH